MQKQTVHVYVFGTLADYEPCHAVVGINFAAFQARPGRYEVRTVGLTRDPMVTMGGITLLPDMVLDDVTPEDSALLMLPGGLAWDELQGAEAVAKALEFLAAGVPVAAICGATAALARAGALDGRRHTSNAPEYLAATGYAGAALYEHKPAVTDQGLITAGAVSALEFAYEILKLLEVYSPETLDAWYGLFKTGEASYYEKLMQSAQG